ncbi:Protein IMPACT [Hypsizygus marmoreus]|uniref:Protein IMPACT n=1 Tax=Hypsizygus marmoreus TaxID=39966 RepID=A0A369JSS1_HYPMA|nr:Protein IMPACT [Hypsizygus marmoreus]
MAHLPNNSSSSTLDLFIKSSRPAPQPSATSQEIRDRGSTFVANLYTATTPEEGRARIKHLKHVVHGAKPASHEVAAWRCMVLKHGRTGLGGPEDFELSVGSMDDGERWAGDKVLKVMQAHTIIDAVVIVSRWYGGTMLGPARFSHIETCATEVCQEYKRTEERRECIALLTTLDAVLAALRAEYSEEVATDQPSMSQPGTTAGKAADSSTPKDYSDIDLAKAKRLIKARENAIKSVTLLLSKRREGVEGPGGNSHGSSNHEAGVLNGEKQG